jgi:hypothetical protein
MMGSVDPVSLEPDWSPADVDVARLWWECGGQWLTHPAVVPVRMTRALAGIVRHLDELGAGLGDDLTAGGAGVIGEHAAALGLRPSTGVVSCGRSTRIVACADSWIAVALARADDVAAVPAWLECEAGDAVWPTIGLVAAQRTARDLIERANLLGIPCSAVGETTDDRAVLVDRVGEHEPSPLSGLVVANLGALWAAPLAADVLGRLGARVITIESAGRPDGARATPTFFAALHRHGEAVALPLHTERGRGQLRELVAAVDVVIEGSRPRALQQMGIDAARWAMSGPRVWVSITAHGRGAAANRVGFGDDAAVAGGLVGRAGGGPEFLGDAIADPLTGLIAAATVAQLVRCGGRWLADVALARVAASMAPRPGDDRLSPLHDPRPPRLRRSVGQAAPLGRDTTALLAELGISE